jgi:hypothetical protein
MVYIKYSGIFNGSFEKQKSAQNKQKCARIRTIRTRDVRVYLVRIYHSRRIHEIYALLTRLVAANCRTPRAHAAATATGEIDKAIQPETVRSFGDRYQT